MSTSENNKPIKNNAGVANNISWSFAEKMMTECINFIVTIVLARLLLPEAYGLVAMLQIFIIISQVFVNFGLGSALIQRKNPDEFDYSTVLIANAVLGIILYLILFLVSPFVASFYNVPQLDIMLKVMALKLPLASIYHIQLAYVQKNMQFKKLFWSSLSGTLAAGAAGIIMAYKGFGAWALVTTTLVDQAVDIIILFFTSGWRPKIYFSYSRYKRLNNFAWKVVVAELISRLYNQIINLIIGKVYTSADLAYHNKGQKYPIQITETLNTTVVRVLFPSFSRHQDNIKEMAKLASRSVRFTSFCLCPLMVGMAITAYQFIPWMLTETWNPCIPYLQMYCFVYLFQPIQSINLKMILSVGRSDIALKVKIISTCLGILLIIATLWLFDTPLAVASSFAVVAVLSLFINGIPCQKLVEYGIWQEFKDILPFLVLSVIMGIAIAPLALLNLSYLPTMALQVLFGMAVYVAGAKLIHCEELDFALKFVKDKINRRKN